MNPALEPDEIENITGKTQPAAQLRQLKRMGIRAYRRENGKGSVCVLHAWLAPAPMGSAESKPILKSEQRRRGQAAQA